MIKDRVLAYCRYKNIAISRFEKDANLSNGYFNQVKKRPSLDKLDKIGKAFDDLNLHWLLTGEGPMLKTEAPDAMQPSSSDNVEVLRERIASLTEQVSLLKQVIREKDEQIELLKRLSPK